MLPAALFLLTLSIKISDTLPPVNTAARTSRIPEFMSISLDI